MRDIMSPGLSAALALPMGLLETAHRSMANRVKDLPQDALDYRGPDGTWNSTAMLLAHVAVVDLGYLHEIMGREIPADLMAEFGPYEDAEDRIPAISGVPAAVLLERHKRLVEMAHAYFAAKEDVEAERPVVIAWWPEPASVRFVLWHMASHTLFHMGQVARLQALYRQSQP